MLGVAGFVALWVVIAVALVLFAMRGGVGGARNLLRHTRGANQFVLGLFVVVTAVFGVALPLLMITGNHDNASAAVGGMKLTAGEKVGRELFGEHCGVCHSLEAANATGKVGPNLDLIKPAESLVLHTIVNGCLPNASNSSGEVCLGYGVMPSAIVTGRDAQDVAAFVAKVAGNE
jgi:mono/diheme cytochrome c family protein